MKILHITESYLPQSQTFIISTLRLVKQFGGENFLLTGALYKSLDSSIDHCKALITVPKSISRFSLVHKVFNRLGPMLFKLRKQEFKSLISKFDIDLIHYHFAWSFELFSDLCDIHAVSAIISFHGSDVFRAKNSKQSIVDFSKRTNVIYTTPSEYLKNELVHWGISSEKIVVLYNTFDSKLFIRDFEERSLDKNYLRVINVSRMIPLKGQRYLIEAFAEFLKTSKGHLTLVGAGSGLAPMVELANSLGIQEYVRFMGELSHDQVRNLMSEHDVYVQPSILDAETNQGEGFGIVLLEAIASGLIVIATNTGGMPEVVTNPIFENQFYFLVMPKDPLEILQVFQHISGPDYEYKSNREYATERLKKFSNHKYMAKLKELYGKLLND